MFSGWVKREHKEERGEKQLKIALSYRSIFMNNTRKEILIGLFCLKKLHNELNSVHLTPIASSEQAFYAV